MKLIPQIRFKGFTDDWEQRKLGDYTDLITKGTTPKDKANVGEVTFVKVENISDGKINSNSRISIDEHENYLRRSKLKENDILFSIAGTLGRTAMVDKSILPANTNQALSIIRGYKFDTDFLLTSLNGKVVNDFIRKNPTIGAQPNLSLEQVGSLIIWTPSKDEQQQIGNFFRQLESTIALHQRKLDLLKETKKGFLQKMFPKNGEKVPEIRFPGFTEDWEERKLGDISDVTKLAGFEFTKYVTYQEKGDIIALRGLNVKNGNLILEDVKYIDQSDFTKLNRSKLFKDDILFTYVGTVGELAIVPENDKFYLAPNVARIRVNSDFNTIFISQLMNDNAFYQKIILPLIATSSQPALSMENIRKFLLNIPCLEEQQKIGSFFKQLDVTIALHQRELDLLKETKKGFLQKMF